MDERTTPTPEEMGHFINWCFENIPPDPTNLANQIGIQVGIAAMSFQPVAVVFSLCVDWYMMYSGSTYDDWRINHE